MSEISEAAKAAARCECQMERDRPLLSARGIGDERPQGYYVQQAIDACTKLLKTQQRVSDNAYNFLHTEYRMAYELIARLLGLIDDAAVQAYICFNKGRHPRDDFTGLMQLPPLDLEPATQLSTDLTGATNPGADASSPSPDTPNLGGTDAEAGSRANDSTTT